jgi:hypothetical protein
MLITNIKVTSYMTKYRSNCNFAHNWLHGRVA